MTHVLILEGLILLTLAIIHPGSWETSCCSVKMARPLAISREIIACTDEISIKVRLILYKTPAIICVTNEPHLICYVLSKQAKIEEPGFQKCPAGYNWDWIYLFFLLLLFFWRNLVISSFGNLPVVGGKTRGICQMTLDLNFWCLRGNPMGSWDTWPNLYGELLQNIKTFQEWLLRGKPCQACLEACVGVCIQ